MIDKLEVVKNRWEEISEQMNDPEVMTDMKRYVKLNKDYKDLEPLITAYKEYKSIISNIEGAREVLETEKDADFREMAKDELDELIPEKEAIEEKIRMLLIPKDPQDSKNAVMEVRAGTGGDEASIFAGDLYRMYQKFCETKNWKIEITRINEGTAGGYKEIVFSITGNGAYGILKFESGVHRVQRVPKTETQGRVHTSAASVVVLPEAEDFDIELLDKDIRRDTYCSSGPGG
ncbi:MAG: PCRF domain-containing protein, partial [Bacteroidetes bacterium]|nr:PCRF domain-containing protein [Bacteroidota bacterium]